MTRTYFNSTFKVREGSKTLKRVPFLPTLRPERNNKPTSAPRRILRKASKSPVAVIKRRIQALVREIVILRDKGCILRDSRRCGGLPGIPGVVLQADHLISRANSATYGDTRLIVCLCRPCHGGYKQWHKPEYDALVRTVISKERVALWDMAQADSHRPHKVDWKLVELSLIKELADLKQE